MPYIYHIWYNCTAVHSQKLPIIYERGLIARDRSEGGCNLPTLGIDRLTETETENRLTGPFLGTETETESSKL